MNIFKKMVSDENLIFVKDKIKLSFFEKNKIFFKYNGGDMETMWNFTKTTHSKGIWFRC